MMWLAAAVILVTTALAVGVTNEGVRIALLFLSAALVVFAVVRAVSRAPGPYGISTRSRTFDVTLLVAFAIAIASITLSLPTSALG
jgi:hypothetical protein